MKKVEPVSTGQDPTIFGIFQKVLPVETVMLRGGDHPNPKSTKAEKPTPRNTRSAVSSLSNLSIWQDEYQS